jgi:hypothetical protein
VLEPGAGAEQRSVLVATYLHVLTHRITGRTLACGRMMDTAGGSRHTTRARSGGSFFARGPAVSWILNRYEICSWGRIITLAYDTWLMVSPFRRLARTDDTP